MTGDPVWHGYKVGDLATWAGAAVTFFAALIALLLGLRDGFRRSQDRRRDATVLLAFLQPELHTIGEALNQLDQRTAVMIIGQSGFTRDELVHMNDLAQANLSAPNLHAHFDKFAVLPGDLGTRLGALLGSLRPIMARTQWIQTNIRSTPPAGYLDVLLPYQKAVADAREDVRKVLGHAQRQSAKGIWKRLKGSIFRSARSSARA